MKSLLLLLLTLVVASSARKYNGYRVLDVGPLKNQQEVNTLLNLVDNDERIRQVILLNDNIAKSSPVSLAVSPLVLDRVTEILDEHNLHFVVINNDLQATFDANMKDNEQRLMRISEQFKDDPTKFDHTAYLRYDEQAAWVSALAAANSDIAKTFILGQSYEQRDILALTINEDDTSLPGIYIESNIHAREWISSATNLYIIDQILTGTSADAVYLRENFRWYFVPNLNPDGYEYCWTGDRMWRKTRSDNSGSVCTGTDANRNWDSNWGGAGTSDWPCDDTYCGTGPFSEAETRAASDFLMTISDHTNLFIDIHCYSNLILVPWGGYELKPPDYGELERVADAGAAAIQSVNGLRFTVGTPPDILYSAAGGSFDWTKEKNNMQYGYGPELRPASAAQGGFDIPPENIIPSGEEIFAMVVAMAREHITKSF